MQTRLPILLAVTFLFGCATTPNRKYAGPVVDLHAHVAFDEAMAVKTTRYEATPTGIVENLRDARVTKLGAMVMAPRGIDKTIEQNDKLLALVATNPRFFAVASVHPDDGDAALQEIDRLAKAGVKLLKLHPNTQHFDLASEAVLKTVVRAGERGLPVIFDSTTLLDPGAIGKFVMLAVRAPKARIVLAHMGGTAFKEMVWFDELRVYSWWPDNVWLELSATAHLFADSPYEDELVWVMRKVGMRHVLFGSDFPCQSTAEAIEDVAKLGLTDAELRAVFFDNANSLLFGDALDAGH